MADHTITLEIPRRLSLWFLKIFFSELFDLIFNSPEQEVLKVSFCDHPFVRQSSTFALLTLYKLYFASDLHES